jgi:hypothetical protein
VGAAFCPFAIDLFLDLHPHSRNDNLGIPGNDQIVKCRRHLDLRNAVFHVLLLVVCAAVRSYDPEMLTLSMIFLSIPTAGDPDSTYLHVTRPVAVRNTVMAACDADTFVTCHRNSSLRSTSTELVTKTRSPNYARHKMRFIRSSATPAYADRNNIASAPISNTDRAKLDRANSWCAIPAHARIGGRFRARTNESFRRRHPQNRPHAADASGPHACEFCMVTGALLPFRMTLENFGAAPRPAQWVWQRPL